MQILSLVFDLSCVCSVLEGGDGGKSVQILSLFLILLVSEGRVGQEPVPLLLGLCGGDWGEDGVQSPGGCAAHSLQQEGKDVFGLD